MTSSARTTILVLSVAMLIGACTGKSAVSYGSVGELGHALSAEDVACDPSTSGSGEAELVKEQGTCEIDGDRLEIFLFEDAEQRDGWLEFGARLRPATATGPNWAVIGEEEVVKTAAEALGGELRE